MTARRTWFAICLAAVVGLVLSPALSPAVETAVAPDPTAIPAAPEEAMTSTGLTASEIVAAADRTRLGWETYVVDVAISNFKQEELDKVSRYQVSIKGADRSLVRFDDPRDRGKYLLTLDESMWLYLPSASRPIRVTALQRLSGNASNGDVAQASYVDSYDAVLAGEEEVEGVATFAVDLTAKKKSGTYRSIRLWVNQTTLLPVRAEFKLTSGRVSKVALFVEYEEVEGQHLLRQQVILDRLRRDQRTVLDFDNYVQQELPDKLFNKNYLSQL